MKSNHNKRKAAPIPLCVRRGGLCRKAKVGVVPFQFLKRLALPQAKVGVVLFQFLKRLALPKAKIGVVILYSLFVLMFFTACNSTNEPMPPNISTTPIDDDDEEETETKSIIDLHNWKVTIPTDDPSEVQPPEILEYATNKDLKKWMYDDSNDSSLVFYTEPGSTTPNSKYSRTELREQIKPGSNTVNWTFAEGGTMKGTLKVADVSGSDDNLDRIIVMQIHGRLTNQQRDLIGEDDNNAPPVLKIYWDDGKINVRRKILKYVEVSDTDILKTDAWKDESHWYEKEIGKDKFTIEIIAKENLLKIILNNGEEEFKFDDVHVEKWAVFENYFKAGNYLQNKEAGAYSLVKFYNLKVIH